MGETIRIANCSGYYGDRLDAAKEMVLAQQLLEMIISDVSAIAGILTIQKAIVRLAFLIPLT